MVWVVFQVWSVPITRRVGHTKELVGLRRRGKVREVHVGFRLQQLLYKHLGK